MALLGRTEYGESVPDPEARNLRTRVARQYDGAGIADSSAYDFKGNLLGSTRQLAAEYAGAVVDWSSEVPLEHREYTASTSYDALNRPVSTTAPDSSVLLPSYDPASLLDRLDGRIRGAAEVTAFAERIEYNARGQRTLVRYGNGTSSAYAYDPLTFRLARLVTQRGSRRLQDLRYTYDAVGNPTQVSDRAQQQSFFRNQVVRPSSRYAYDALYRLLEATGREHLGQSGAGLPQPVPPGATDAPGTGLPQPGDGAAMARYTERYTYDEAGNLLLVRHRSADRAYGGWTRAYHYEEPSLLEPDRAGNRLTGAGPARDPAPPQRFGYDEQGDMTSMPEIPLLQWDYADRLHATARHSPDGGSNPQETTYYVYDATGQRARKVTQRVAVTGPAARKSERIYVGAFEVFREYNPDGAAYLERETLHVFDDKQRLALIENRTIGTDQGPGELIRYQLANHLDSSVLELDQAGQMISYEEYYPYGSTSYQAVRALIETPKRYRYTGKEHDTETGLYYHGARYYIPWLGRWASCDPAGLADGPNLYQAMQSNPVRLKDTNGKQSGEPNLPKVSPSSAVPIGVDSNGNTVYVLGIRSDEPEKIEEVTVHGQRPANRPQKKPAPTGSTKKPDHGQPGGQAKPGTEAKPGAGPGVLASGVRGTKDAVARKSYETQIKERSQGAQEKINALRESDAPGDSVTAWEEAQDASKFRETIRTQTRTKLSTPARVLSETIDETRSAQYYADKASSPPEIRKNVKVPEGPPATETRIGAPEPQGSYVYDTAESIAEGAGKSRGGLAGLAFKGARYAGPAGIIVGLGLSARSIVNAPPEERIHVATEQAGRFGGSYAGAEIGSAIALGVAAVLLGATPVGWLAVGIAFGGAMIGGYVGGEAGGALANGLFHLF
jgi:RHS repeat-associated protein